IRRATCTRPKRTKESASRNSRSEGLAPCRRRRARSGRRARPRSRSPQTLANDLATKTRKHERDTMGLLRVFVSSWLLLLASAAAIGCGTRGDVSASQPPPAADTPTLSFYRNPSPVAPFTVRDIDGRHLSSADWRGQGV